MSKIVLILSGIYIPRYGIISQSKSGYQLIYRYIVRMKLIFRFEDAIPDFESVLKLKHDMACAHVNLGLIYLNKLHNCHRFDYFLTNLYFKMDIYYNYIIIVNHNDACLLNVLIMLSFN